MTWKDILKLDDDDLDDYLSMDEIDSDFMDVGQFQGDDFKKLIKIKRAIKNAFGYSNFMIRDMLDPVYGGQSLDEFIDDEIKQAKEDIEYLSEKGERNEDVSKVKQYLDSLNSIKG